MSQGSESVANGSALNGSAANGTAVSGPVAFVLGGGGVRGAHQVGMLRALFERGVVPDLVIGTSAGSIQGAMLAADPMPAVLDMMTDMWREFTERRVMKASVRNIASNVAHLRPTLTSNDKLQQLLIDYLGADTRIENLSLPYQACAASIERATARYFDSGPLVPAVMASCAVPGLWPPVEIGGEHYIDGGVVETVPVSRAVSEGARTIYVLRLRQREPLLRAPRWPWQLGSTVYEVSRRYHLGRVLNQRPDGVVVHVLPSGEETLAVRDGLTASSREDAASIRQRMAEGYRVTSEYLDAVEDNRSLPRAASATGLGAVRAPGSGTAADLAKDFAKSDAKISVFVAEKLADHFDHYDRDGDGFVGASDYRDAAERIAAAFRDASDTDPSPALEAAYDAYWQRMSAAAETALDARLSRTAFERALLRLVGDEAAYRANLLPVIAAIMEAADDDHNAILNPAEIKTLLRALGVAEADAAHVARRLDTNDDGVVTLDELSEAFHDYFTSDEPGCVGNSIFGRSAVGSAAWGSASAAIRPSRADQRLTTARAARSRPSPL